MRYDIARAVTDWTIYEFIDRRGNTPCSDEFSNANDTELADVYESLRLLRAAGVPPDRTRGNPEVEAINHKCPHDHNKTAFFVLKAKPSGWRLYFRIADRETKQIEFLFATNKKKNARDPEDLDRCCTILRAIQSGNCSRAELAIPDR